MEVAEVRHLIYNTVSNHSLTNVLTELCHDSKQHA